MRLKEKVALITGAGSGIGRQSALLFAREGAAVLVVDVNDAAGNETVTLVKQAGGRAAYCRADVSKAAECQRMVAAAEQEFGKLSVLFNNAGIMHAKDDDAISTSEEVWDLTLDINAKGVFLGCKYGIPALKRAGGGSIINTASFVARLGAATPQVAYTASKGAVLAMTRELAVIHAREHIRVNALSPGPLKTELLMSFLNTDSARRRRSPARRFSSRARSRPTSPAPSSWSTAASPPRMSPPNKTATPRSGRSRETSVQVPRPAGARGVRQGARSDP